MSRLVLAVAAVLTASCNIIMPRGRDGSSPRTAFPLAVPTHQKDWGAFGEMGLRCEVPLRSVGDVFWFTFDLENDSVVYLARLGGEGALARVELLDSSMSVIAGSKNRSTPEEVVCQQNLGEGRYYVRVTSIKAGGHLPEITLCQSRKE